MSGYQYGQGQWPPPPQSSQYDYSPASNQSQYPYQQPPSQDPQQAYYGAAHTAHASQAAFDHNAQAPASDMGLNSAGSRSPNAVGGEMSWSQAFGGGAPASAPSSSHNPSAPSYQPHQHLHHYQDQSQQLQLQHHQQQSYQSPNSRTPTGYQQQQQYNQQQYTLQAYQPPPPPPPPQHQAYTALSYPSVEQGRGSEEGELSDDMDDIYDPEEPADPAPRSTSSQDAPAQPTEVHLQPASPEMPGTALGQAAVDMPSRDASVIDTQDDAFYDDDDDEPGEIKSTGNGVSTSDAADADFEDMDYSDSATNKSLAAAAGEAAQDRAMSYSPRLSPGEIDDSAAPPAEINGATNGHQQVAAPSAANYATVDEAKKKAQQAILRLIRYDVNYQTFVDEGVDGQVLKSLFTELGLRIDSVKEAEGSASPVQTPAEAPLSQEQEPQDRPSTADASTSQKEERKDRIARLLALKKAAKPAPAPAPIPTVPAASASNAKSEKSRLLQQKLEALKQMHEKRAAAAAAKAAEVAAPAATPAAPAVLPASIHHSLPPRPVTSNSFSLPPAPAVIDATNSRKRPVAADFGDFSQTTQVPAYKRPYGMARQESTLVIDLSDDESQNDRDEGEYDEEDDNVEMEIESVDEAVSPVTNFSHKKMQPPTAPASMIARAKDKDDEYARKMRQIEDMKRKIAEIEAKKQRGSSGSLTPVTGGHGTPPEAADSPKTVGQGRNFDATQIVRPPLQPMRRITSTGEMSGELRTGSGVPDDMPIRLPKRGEQPTASPLPSLQSVNSQSSRGLREERVRSASLQLPRVEASLQEKMFKLRLLQDKVKALQTEISDGMAEKERLTQDLEAVDTESEAVDAIVNDGNSRSGSVIVIDSPAVASPAQETVEETSQQVGQPVEAEVVKAVAEFEPPADVDGSSVRVEAIKDVNAKPVEAHDAVEAVADEADEYEPMLSGDEQGSESAPMSVASSMYDPEDVGMEDQSGEDGEVEEEEEKDQEEGREEDDDNSDEDMMMEDDGEVFTIDDGEPSNAAPTPAEEVASEPAEAAKAEAEAEIEEEIEADLIDDVVQPPAPAPTTTVAMTSKPTSESTTIPPLTTYDSPLKYFKSYRFHPQYKTQVTGGLRSLTYSGKIRDDIPLCPSESAGEVCDNPACPFQHFQSIQPEDDQILVELGRSDEYTGEQQSRFVDGLKAVLKRVRDEQVRDFETIAEAIIEFRREFLADKTRVLANLGGTTV